MTRKHFTALALTMKNSRPDRNGPWLHPDRAPLDEGTMLNMIEAWQATVRGVRDICIDSNPLFDVDRFMNACDYWDVQD